VAQSHGPSNACQPLVIPGLVFESYLADIDQTAHQLCVAHRVDGSLCILACSVLHNTTTLFSEQSSVNHLPLTTANCLWTPAFDLPCSFRSAL
jgi:hypothetical protein